MLELLPHIILAVLAVHGCGLVFGRWRGSGDMDLFIWWGFRGLGAMAVLATLGGVFNLFLPLTAVAPWLMLPLALLGGWSLLRQPAPNSLIFLGFLVVLSAALASRVCSHGDTGGYHQQAVVWISETALPYGLANLHGRFGFNSAWWSFAALLQMPWMARGAAMYLATPVLCVFFGLLFAGALRCAWNSKLNVADAMILAAGYLWFRQMSGANNPSLSTDAPVNLFIVASAVALVLWRSERAPQLLLVWSLLAFSAAAFKLTGIPWLVASAAVVGWTLAVPPRESRRTPALHQEILAAMVGLVLLTVNFARGFMLSGYPLYPLKLFGLGWLPWAVQPETIGGDTEGIRNWPTRGEAANWMGFTRNWIENQYGMTNVVTALVLAFAIAALLFAVWHRSVPSARASFIHMLPVVFAAAAGLVVCWVYAPALRFVSGYFFTIVGILLGAGLSALPSAGSVRQGRIAVVIAIVFAVLPNFGGLTSRAVSWWQTPPAPETEAALVIRTTSQGEPIKIGAAWDTEPPATPYFNPDLVVVRDQSGAIREFRAKSD